MKFVTRVATLGLALSMTGCYSQTFGAPNIMDNEYAMTRVQNAKVVGHLHAEAHQWFIIGGLVPIGGDNLDTIIRRETNGNSVQNLTIHTEQSFTDGLVSVLLTALASGVGTAVGSAGGSSNATSSALTGSVVGGVLGLLVPQFRTITIDGDVVERPAATH